MRAMTVRKNERANKQAASFGQRYNHALPHEFYSRWTLGGHVKKKNHRRHVGGTARASACFGNCYVRSRPEVREILREDKRSFGERRNPRVKY